MAQLALQVLGELQVSRGSESLPLPPSRKTRALLAYLALNPRTLRRDTLCELLWEIPDDPRGSLRWSLSKLRKLVNDEDHTRIVADRSSISFQTDDVQIDLQQLYALLASDLAALPLAELDAAATRFNGTFLEGLELNDFHDYYTWCIGERERARAAQTRLLQHLVERLAEQPERALDYANRLVTLNPFDAGPRARLIELLRRLGRPRDAEQQYRMGIEKSRESGASDTTKEVQQLNQALRGGLATTAPGDLPAAAPAPATPGLQQGVDTTLVGRQRELQWLAENLALMQQQGRARVLLIRGDPGLGKSRLLQAAVTIARQNRISILKASCFESERMRPFAAWNDALRRARPDNPASRLLQSGEQVSREQVFSCLSDLLAESVTRQPMMILFDDAHWGDESSASALLYALRMNRHRPIMVVSAAREHELRENVAVQQCITGLRQDQLLQELYLEPLQDADLHALIAARMPTADAERLSRESGGNPLLALELARAELEGNPGNSLSELVQERLRRLDGEAIGVLKWAAVLAPRINIRSLEQVTGLHRDAIDNAIEAAEAQGLLQPGERGFRFSHDLLGSAAYQLISPARRRSMHQRVAQLLEQEATVDLALAAALAHHAQRSGDPALAARAIVSAGRLCLRFYAYPDALELYQRGLHYAAKLDDAERVCRQLELEELKATASPESDWQSAAQRYVALAEQALDHGSAAHARVGYQLAAYTRWSHGAWSSARRDSLQAERITRHTEGKAQVLGMAEAAKCLALLERDLSQADAMLMEAEALARRQQINCGTVALADGMLRYHEGRFEEAAEQLQTARAIYKAEGDRINEFLANEYLAMLEMERLDCSAATQHAHALQSIGERLPEGSEAPFARALLALCQEKDRAEQPEFEAALQDLRAADAKQRLVFLLNRAALMDLRQQRLARAQQRAREALPLAELMQRPSEILMALATLVEIHRNDPEIERDSHAEQFARQLDAPIAGWARARAEQLTGNGG